MALSKDDILNAVAEMTVMELVDLRTLKLVRSCSR